MSDVQIHVHSYYCQPDLTGPNLSKNKWEIELSITYWTSVGKWSSEKYKLVLLLFTNRHYGFGLRPNLHSPSLDSFLGI